MYKVQSNIILWINNISENEDSVIANNECAVTSAYIYFGKQNLDFKSS